MGRRPKEKNKKEDKKEVTPKSLSLMSFKDKGRFLPGSSENPMGRAKITLDVKKLAREHTEAAIITLVEIMLDKELSANARVTAANSVLDRGYGRPVQQVEVGDPGDFTLMSDSDVDAFIVRALGDLTEEKKDLLLN